MLSWLRRAKARFMATAKNELNAKAAGNTNVLYAYCCTVDGSPFSRLKKSISEQYRRNQETMLSSYLFIDKMPDQMPEIIKRFFGPRIKIVDPYIFDPHGEKQFCMPLFRNASIAEAKKQSADYLFCCDSDTVIYHVSPPEKETVYAFPFVYWQRGPDETIETSIQNIESEGKSAFSEGNSWFIIHKSIFNEHDFNERMLAYGYEDWEFQQKASFSVPQQDRCDTRIIHLFHTMETRRINDYHLNRNRNIWQATCLAQKQRLLSHWKFTEVVEAIHPLWRIHLVFDRRLGTVFNGPAEIVGTYVEQDDAYLISWNGGSTETFRKRGSFIEYAADGVPIGVNIEQFN